jgi:PAS domain S-box-containing protein
MLSTFDLKLYDTLLKLRYERTSSVGVVIVDIDTKSLSKYGQWPWPRYRMAQLMDKLRNMGARSVGVDILFSEPDRSSLFTVHKNNSSGFNHAAGISGVPRHYIDNDAMLAAALRKGPFVLGYQFLFGERIEKRCILHPVNVLIRKEHEAPDSRHGLLNPSSVDCIYPPLANAAPASGFLNVQPDQDGIVRRVPLIMEYDGRFYAHLTLATFLAASRQKQMVLTVGQAGTERLSIENFDIPLDHRGSFLIPFHGPNGTYRHISAFNILNGRTKTPEVKGHIVITGVVAPGLLDIHATPTEPAMAGVEMLANIIDAILQRNFIGRPKAAVAYEFITVVFFGLFSTVLLARYKTVANLAFLFLFALAAVIVTYFLFRKGIYVSPLYPVLAYTSNFSLLSVLDFWHKERLLKEKTKLQLSTQEALQESKEKISQILNSTSEGIYGLDLNGNCTFCNPSGIRILRYNNEDDLIGENIHDLVHHTKADGTPYPKDNCATHRAIAKGEYIHRDREILWRSDGTSFSAELWAHPISRGNELIGAVVTFIDITERVALENQLLHAQKMEAVGTLAGGIAHDFNNILSAILGYADLLHMKMSVNDPLRANVEEILESVERAAHLTHSLLAFSTNQLMTVKAVDLVNLLSGLGKMLVRIIGEDIEFRTEFRQKSLFIMADSGQIEQVIMNLATNARDAMPKGGTLTIVTDLAAIDEAACEAHGCEIAGNYVIITVSDTGMGMSKETMKRIFDPFFTTKNIGKGTGLGLSIVYGIVRQHNGFIDVDSEQGKGTTFRIHLPAIEAVATEKTEPTPANVVDKGTETILVAEDDRALRELSQTVLESFGYKVILAEDGQDAVRKFTVHNKEIGLVILDMMMPKMTGVEAYEAIRDIRPGVKSLFLSGYTADKVRETGLIADGMEIVMKPISPRDLLKTVRRVLDSRV